MSSRARSKWFKKTLLQLREPPLARLRRKFRIRSLNELKKEAINRVLKVTSDKRLAATLLGIGAATFYRWEIELGIRPPDIRSYRRFGAVQRVRVAPQLRQQSGIKTLRELRQGEITRVLRLTDGNARLTAKLLAISKTTVSRHAHGQGKGRATQRLR